MCRNGHLPLGPCAGRTACGLRLGGTETEYRSLSESLGMQEVGPLVGRSGGGSVGVAVMGLEYKVLEAFWGFSWECLIWGPCASKCIHRLWLLGIRAKYRVLLEMLG